MFDDHKTPEYFAWLATVEVGTKVPRWGTSIDGGYWRLDSITRVTPQRIYIGSDCYDRTTGDGKSDGIRFLHLQPMTDEIRAKVIDRAIRNKALKHIGDITFRDLPTETLVAIAKVLEMKNPQ